MAIANSTASLSLGRLNCPAVNLAAAVLAQAAARLTQQLPQELQISVHRGQSVDLVGTRDQLQDEGIAPPAGAWPIGPAVANWTGRRLHYQLRQRGENIAGDAIWACRVVPSSDPAFDDFMASVVPTRPAGGRTQARVAQNLTIA